MKFFIKKIYFKIIFKSVILREKHFENIIKKKYFHDKTIKK